MKKKTFAAVALASCLALTATFTGCTLVSTNNKADMSQVVATVDITKLKDFNDTGLSKYKDAIKGETEIYKRDLVTYFLNVGYSLVQNGSYSYEDVFNLLMNALVENAVLVQYSTLALLDMKAESNSGVYEEFKSKTTQIDKYVYLLGGENSDEVNLAKYNLYSTINTAIDRSEKTLIDEENGYVGTGSRTTPVNLETEQDKYYPKSESGALNYNIYTGYHGFLLEDSGAYKDDALKGTKRSTRVKAYNTFLKSLADNNLISKEEEESGLKDITKLSYFEDEYLGQLENRVIQKYLGDYEDAQAEKLKANDYEYVKKTYNQLLAYQEKNYDSSSAFETAMGSLSDNTFLLYSPATDEDNEFEDLDKGYYGENYGQFGFVYNILLPFSAKQSMELTRLKTLVTATEDQVYYYNGRNSIMQKIQTEDQRSAWFNGATDYSFKASESGITPFGASDYLFFEGNMTDSGEGKRYKELKAYDGHYSYNGTVYENKDGSYTLLGNKLDIDDMLKEFNDYVNFVLNGYSTAGEDHVTYSTKAEGTNSAYYTPLTEDTLYKAKENEDDNDEIDYSNFLYAYGKVDLGDFNKSDLYNANAASNQYKAMSAVNELQFAYTTDTSVLSQYVGYSVGAYATSFIKEFEYAAKVAISNGPGAFTVCAGDYGWHLIYVTYVFGDGEVYTPDWNNYDKEGTFEYMFFEWIKDKDLSDISTTHRSKLLNDFNKEDESVVKFQKRYQDLLDLDKQ